MKDQALAEQIAFNLQRPGFEMAFVVHNAQIFAAYCRIGFFGPSSAVIKLLQSLFDEHRDQSFFILRKRIFTNAALKAQCVGMVKVVAKRVSGEILPIDHGLPVPMDVHFLGGEFELSSLNLLSPENRMPLQEISALNQSPPLRWLRALGALNSRGEVLHDFDRDIACLMLDSTGVLLGFGLNCNSKNKTLHAEVNMIQRFYRETGRRVPAGARILTTRKPCQMCAGMIFDASENPSSLRIEYSEEDKSSRQTVLDAVVHWNRLDTL